MVATPNGERLEYLSETKLLGKILTKDSKAYNTTKHMAAKTYKRMRLLRRSAKLTSDRQEL